MLAKQHLQHPYWETRRQWHMPALQADKSHSQSCIDTICAPGNMHVNPLTEDCWSSSVATLHTSQNSPK